MIRKLIRYVGGTFFPPFCVHCGREGKWLCALCEQKLTAFPHTICPSCNIRTIEGRLNPSCIDKTGLARFLAVYPLRNSVAAALIYGYKYRHGSILHQSIFTLMHTWIQEQSLDALLTQKAVLVIPVPLHERRERWRGFNQAGLLARDIARHYNLPLSENILTRVKHTPSQLEMPRLKEREENMQDAFTVSEGATSKNKCILLVDDVYTTGATMRACAKALREAGVREIWGMTFARG